MPAAHAEQRSAAALWQVDVYRQRRDRSLQAVRGSPNRRGCTVNKEAKDFSIIDRALSIEGALVTTGKLIVRGSVKGTLSAGTVIIAKGGAVNASVCAGAMTIGGAFDGDIRVSGPLTVLATGTCAGKAVCRDFVVEAGGQLNAEVTCTAGQGSGKALPAPAAS
jgi:cytoskeletal protein CcmA (bactofilin family)